MISLRRFIVVLFLFSILPVSGCNTPAVLHVDEPDVTSLPATRANQSEARDDYTRSLMKWTVDDALYKGLQNIFQYHASLMTREVLALQVAKRATFNGWDNTTFRAEREKALQEASSSTRVFLAFYAPERINDRLLIKESPWHFYLQVGRSRYQGKIRKSPYSIPESRRLFPYFDSWVTGYVIDFPVPTAAIEGTDSVRFVLTGAPGTSEKVFVLEPSSTVAE